MHHNYLFKRIIIRQGWNFFSSLLFESRKSGNSQKWQQVTPLWPEWSGDHIPAWASVGANDWSFHGVLNMPSWGISTLERKTKSNKKVVHFPLFNSTVIVVMSRLLLTLLLRINSWRVWHSPDTSGCPVNNAEHKKTSSFIRKLLPLDLFRKRNLLYFHPFIFFSFLSLCNICLYIYILVLVETGCVYYWLTRLLPWEHSRPKIVLAVYVTMKSHAPALQESE